MQMKRERERILLFCGLALSWGWFLGLLTLVMNFNIDVSLYTNSHISHLYCFYSSATNPLVVTNGDESETKNKTKNKICKRTDHELLCVNGKHFGLCAQNQSTIRLLGNHYCLLPELRPGEGRGHFTMKAVGGFAMFVEKPTIAATPLPIIAVYTEATRSAQYVKPSSLASTQCDVTW